MADLIPAETEIVAGLELRGIPLVTAISLETGLPAAFVRKEAKAYGTCQAIEGQDVFSRRVTFIEDVISTGGAVKDAHRMAVGSQAHILAVVCAIGGALRSKAFRNFASCPLLREQIWKTPIGIGIGRD
ncbi:hypothetical protein PY650_02220 [Rhizobium calliandrae]|uniref:Orotate phosphoribosyltransferase n=1 Tax=Rhizobium calliandrae TaxID=1312182 RepID=A0ABT7K7B1_9HYPH|nr:hypothetical protein [Rhizobium calliandrae]MDL2404488.1 hypothetical protein [Rhizobium calliandrae]